VGGFKLSVTFGKSNTCLKKTKSALPMAHEKETLLLLHGALGSAAQMQPLADLLQSAYDVHLLTYKGHDGKTPGKYAFSIQFFSNDVVNYMRENNIKKCSIIGYSMGGYVGLFLARYQPELVNRVFTLGTKLDWTPQSAAVELTKLNAERIQEKVPTFAEELKQLHGSKNWTVVLNNTADMMRKMGENPPLSLYDISRLSQVVMLTTGDKDGSATPEEVKRICATMPKGRYHIFKNTPHPISQVNLERVAEVFRDFQETPVWKFEPQV